MELSVYLAKIIGLYLILFMVTWSCRKEEVCSGVEELFANRGLLILSGMISLAMGVAIIIGHPVYEWNWRGLITALGYVSITKGIIRLGFPDFARNNALKIMHGPGCIVMSLLIILIGGYLTYHGFTTTL